MSKSEQNKKEKLRSSFAHCNTQALALVTSTYSLEEATSKKSASHDYGPLVSNYAQSVNRLVRTIH